MRRARVCLLGVLVAVGLAGAAVLVTTREASAQRKVVVKDHWRWHDGRWNYWNEADRAWYYTDGTNWFYYDEPGSAWKVYRFDRRFGRDGFERSEYRVPGVDVRVTVPRHRIYRPR